MKGLYILFLSFIFSVHLSYGAMCEVEMFDEDDSFIATFQEDDEVLEKACELAINKCLEKEVAYNGFCEAAPLSAQALEAKDNITKEVEVDKDKRRRGRGRVGVRGRGGRGARINRGPRGGSGPRFNRGRRGGPGPRFNRGRRGGSRGHRIHHRHRRGGFFFRFFGRRGHRRDLIGPFTYSRSCHFLLIGRHGLRVDRFRARARDWHPVDAKNRACRRAWRRCERARHSGQRCVFYR